MAVKMYQGNLPHIYWIDLEGNGMFTECAVMKKDNLGNTYFFPLTALDNVDKGRLARIVQNRNANNFQLWELMEQITLNNGVNALDYFHQLVEMISSTGKRVRPKEGIIGTGMIDTVGVDRRQESDKNITAAAQAAADAAANAVLNTRFSENATAAEAAPESK
jgi:hypothetical protein